jgi:hypothetical protein
MVRTNETGRGIIRPGRTGVTGGAKSRNDKKRNLRLLIKNRQSVDKTKGPKEFWEHRIKKIRQKPRVK